MNTWEIESIKSVPKFIAAIAQFLPAAHTICFEVRGACAEALVIFSKHRSKEKYRPCRDTIFPRTQLHYCTISQALADDIEQLLDSHKIKEIFWHIKGFDERCLLFAIHDADLGDPAYLSGQIDCEIVGKIGSAIRRKPTNIQTQYKWDKDYRYKKHS